MLLMFSSTPKLTQSFGVRRGEQRQQRHHRLRPRRVIDEREVVAAEQVLVPELVVVDGGELGKVGRAVAGNELVANAGEDVVFPGDDGPD